MPQALARAVVDTNILVRGILRRRESAAVGVLDALVRRDFRPLVSDYVLAEVRKTLREPDVRALRRLEDDETGRSFLSAGLAKARCAPLHHSSTRLHVLSRM